MVNFFKIFQTSPNLGRQRSADLCTGESNPNLRFVGRECVVISAENKMFDRKNIKSIATLVIQNLTSPLSGKKFGHCVAVSCNPAQMNGQFTALSPLETLNNRSSAVSTGAAQPSNAPENREVVSSKNELKRGSAEMAASVLNEHKSLPESQSAPAPRVSFFVWFLRFLGLRWGRASEASMAKADPPADLGEAGRTPPPARTPPPNTKTTTGRRAPPSNDKMVPVETPPKKAQIGPAVDPDANEKESQQPKIVTGLPVLPRVVNAAVVSGTRRQKKSTQNAFPNNGLGDGQPYRAKRSVLNKPAPESKPLPREERDKLKEAMAVVKQHGLVPFGHGKRVPPQVTSSGWRRAWFNPGTIVAVNNEIPAPGSISPAPPKTHEETVFVIEDLEKAPPEITPTNTSETGVVGGGGSADVFYDIVDGTKNVWSAIQAPSSSVNGATGVSGNERSMGANGIKALETNTNEDVSDDDQKKLLEEWFQGHQANLDTEDGVWYTTGSSEDAADEKLLFLEFLGEFMFGPDWESSDPRDHHDGQTSMSFKSLMTIFFSGHRGPVKFEDDGDGVQLNAFNRILDRLERYIPDALDFARRGPSDRDVNRS